MKIILRDRIQELQDRLEREGKVKKLPEEDIMDFAKMLNEIMKEHRRELKIKEHQSIQDASKTILTS